MNRNLPWLRSALLAAALLVAPLAGMLNGCGGGGGSSSPTPTTTPYPEGTVVGQSGWTIDSPAYVQPTKAWTVLIYMNGANDLEEFATDNANMMEAMGSNANVNIVLQFKRMSGYDTSDGNWIGTRRYYITKDTNTSHVSSTVLSEKAILDMGNKQTLQDFIQWGIATYPAQHYCLVIWNHGAGWRSVKLPNTRAAATNTLTRGVSYDDEFGTHIETTDLPSAMDLGNGQKWDLLAWDASLMQMCEVDYEIRDKVQYIVGSEESPPGLGYPYHLWLQDLQNNITWDGKALGTDIAQKTMTFYQGSASPWGSNDWGSSGITQSVIDASKMDGVAATVNTLGSALMNAKGTYSTAIANDRSLADSYDYPENRDLKDFTRLLATKDSATGLTVSNDSGVSSAISQVNSAISAAVLYNTRGSGHSGSNGLAILLTSPADYKAIDQEQATGNGPGSGTLRYSSLSFSKAAPNWQNFLVNGPP